ncbi:MAG TPA: SDR family NAD(P)-dependent oxidoreductase, partial [Burkholderiaceae bacterium]
MTPLVSLKGHTVVVTGAGQGIGKALAELVIELDGQVVAIDMNPDTLKAAMAPLPAERVMTVVGSVADLDLATKSVSEAVERFGAIHGLVNNAGITRPAMIEKMTAKQWQDVIDVHLTGSFYWLQAVGRHMVSRARDGDKTGGSIINISSDAGRKGSIGQINYAAAKAGMLAMTMTAAKEWGRYNI